MSMIPPAGRRLASALTVLAAATLSACAGSAPVAVAPPLPRPAPPVRPQEPPPPAPVAVAVAPVAPAQAPRGTVASRAYYAGADVTEWTLTNGATVVFKPLPNGGNVDLVGVDSAPGSCTSRYSEQRPTGDLAGLFREALGARAVYVVVGDARPGEVEQAAARLLTRTPPSAPCVGPASLAGSFTVPTDADADAVLAVLIEVLRVRGSEAFARSAGGRTTLGGASGAALAALRPSDADMATARAAASRRPEAAAFWLDALASLYSAPGDVRPSRDPAFVSRFPTRVARVSAASVASLAARFAASPSN